MASRKIYKFKNIKNPAGKEIQRLSFIFILTIKPLNIRRLRPRADIDKIGLNMSPTISPVAPTNCKIMIKKPSLSNLNRLNSFFILGDMK